jgi:hypothetical protein
LHLDEGASILPIKETGHSTGIGFDVAITIAEFNKTQRTQHQQTRGSSNSPTVEKGYSPSPKQRPSKDEYAAAEVMMAERHAVKAAAAAENTAAAQATAEAAYSHEM